MRADVDRDPAVVCAAQFDLTGMEAHTYLDAERSQAVAKFAPALDGPRRSVEGGEHAVARRLDPFAPVDVDLSTGDGVVLVEDRVGRLGL
jgi:hypothetical protein